MLMFVMEWKKENIGKHIAYLYVFVYLWFQQMDPSVLI